MSKFCQIFFGTETEAEAQKIIDVLFETKLIACADVFPINANYCWKGKIQKEKRYQIIAYSMAEFKDKIIRAIQKIHSDEVPAIVFIPIEANQEYLDWIKESLNT